FECHRVRSCPEVTRAGVLCSTRRADLLQGGDAVPAIVAGDPEKRLLIKAVRYTDENLQMPPKGKKLSLEQIADLETWVKIGAPDPRIGKTNATASPESIASKARAHWAFQHVHQPTVPEIRNQRWVRTPVDTFVL